jgi:molybdopterin synthase catalytic subunit
MMPMVRVEIMPSPLEADRSWGLPRGREGAVVEFQGIVREDEGGKPIRALEYECHVPMAQAQLERIASQVAAFYGLAELLVLHRIGAVPVGEASLYVRAVAVHRREAFAAALELIERLKRDVPIWKHAVVRHDR